MKKILIVDGDSTEAALFRKNLEERGYQIVDVVPDGKGAIIAVITRAPDLIIVDVHLAGLPNGIETVERIRRFSPVPVLFTTAHLNPRLAERAGCLPRSLFMYKPVDPGRLADNVRLLLRIH